jgi:hypothetical protein
MTLVGQTLLNMQLASHHSGADYADRVLVRSTRGDGQYHQYVEGSTISCESEYRSFNQIGTYDFYRSNSKDLLISFTSRIT